ncbi:thioredoxin-like protein [Melampsora americana]|nr:thioredoxin-like protein [Melampsora americana]
MKQSNSLFLGSLFFSLIGINVVLAGLEDAKHSIKLDHANFDAQIQNPKVGTLVAFFAPWCGHCKSLLGTWDTIAQTFASDSNCRVGHLDANEASNRDLATRFSVSGFPTIKFLYKDSSKAALDYNGPRTPDAFIKFLNENCGTHRASGGLLLPEAGRVAGLDTLVAEFVGLPVSGHASLIKKATKLASSTNEALANYYVKVMNKISTDENWVTKEAARLKKLAEKSATMASSKYEELQIKQNILQVFISAKEKLSSTAESVKEGAQKTAETVKETAEQVIEKVTGEL